MFVFRGVFDSEVKHNELGVIRPGTISYEFFWRSRWYNIFRFHEPEGDFRNFYCNINQPPVIKDNSLNYVDLDIDVLIGKDFSIDILDKEEFEQSALKFAYSEDLQSKVKASLNDLLKIIKRRNFPFDFKI
jgi:protein associated with RNAse G/E